MFTGFLEAQIWVIISFIVPVVFLIASALHAPESTRFCEWLVQWMFLISNFRRVLNVVYVLFLGISPASDCSLPMFRNPLSFPSSKAGCGVWSEDSERTHGIYTRAGVLTGAVGPIGDQVVGGTEWVGRSGVGGIKDACQVAVGLLCIVCVSRFSLSVCRRGFQAVLKIRPSSWFILFGCISVSIASLMRRSEYPVFAERSLVSCSLMMWSGWDCALPQLIYPVGPV